MVSVSMTTASRAISGVALLTAATSGLAHGGIPLAPGLPICPQAMDKAGAIYGDLRPSGAAAPRVAQEPRCCKAGSSSSLRSAISACCSSSRAMATRCARAAAAAARGLLIYPLSLAIYCTSWTFFGSVGLASRTGYDFLTIYIGPMLMIGLCSPLIMRIVRLAKAQNITSIADFIAARYGKNQAVAATVALIAIVGTIPYIALQLKAVSASLSTILAHLDIDDRHARSR